MHWFSHLSIILASASPRRAGLLRETGFHFSVRTRTVEEDYPPELPADQVPEYLALLKAQAQKDYLIKNNDVLITADSVVILNDRILGKPAGREEARTMLMALSGQKHRVITGVCLCSLSRQLSFSVCSTVTMANMDPDEIDYYIDTYQPYDKAGSYGIQEWIGFTHIQRIEGSYTNIMGLPMRELYAALKEF